ncbi:hypothetical protein, partial [Oryzihumus sp.]|uniref:hypothetical protein n=1 Tax=Oryzihumus sp. TaxID=1968903 RepID=UPI002ED781C9
DRVVAAFTAGLDQALAGMAAAHEPVDAAKESTARAALLSALRDALIAAGPYARQSFATDPLSAGAPARIAALEAQAGRLPQNAALDAALNNYIKVVGASLGQTLPGLRADTHSTRSHTTVTLPKVPWLH